MNESQTEQLIAKHTTPIAEALRRLEQLLANFGTSLGHSASPAVVFEPVLKPDAASSDRVVRYRELGAGLSRQAAIEALLKIEYDMEDAVNESIKCYGAVGVPMRLISDVIIVNRAKSELKAAMQTVARKRVRVPIRDSHGEPAVAIKNLSNVVLRRIQKSSVNLLAAYREIPILDETPYSIQLMQTLTRSVPRKTAAELLSLLADRDDGLAAADRERLEALDPTEYLVSPKERYPRMRAHVFFRRQDASGHRERHIVMAELPILYPIRKGVRPPDITPPKLRQNPRKHPQSRIEAEEYVRTLHYRRMRPEFRAFANVHRARGKKH